MQDLRLAFRSLRATPVVTVFAVLSLALGIGANSAIFSLVDNLVLKELPVNNPARLYLLSIQGPSLPPPQFSVATVRQLRRIDVFEGVAGWTNCCGQSIVRMGLDHELANRVFVTGDYFPTLGVTAARGRLLTLADDEANAPDGPVVVIGDRLWRTALGGRADVIGLRLTVDSTSVTIVGVTPPDFGGLEIGRTVDVFAPQHLAAQMTSSPFDDDNAWLNVMVRVKPTVTGLDARAILRSAQPYIRTASMPTPPRQTFLANPLTLTAAAHGTSALRQRFERPLVVVFAIVVFVLLIACANVGNLLLARGMARQHEFSVRVALGASRSRLARQVFVESAVLGTTGALAGLLITSSVTHTVLSALSSVRQPLPFDTPVDWQVLTFTTAVTVATTLLCGTIPAVRATGAAPIEALKAQGRNATARHGLASSLLVAQIALSMLLVVAGALFVQTFERLTHARLGLDTGHTVVAFVNAATVPAVERPVFFDRMAQAVGRVAGVAAAGGSLNPPIVGSLFGDLVVSPPGVAPPTDAERIPVFDSITPHWFAAYGIPLLRGRDFDERDARTSPPVIVVSEAFVQHLFPGRDVIGMPLSLTLRYNVDEPFGTRTVIGVVADTVHRTPRDPLVPTIYSPLAQQGATPQKDFYMGVRATAGSPVLLERQLAAAITTFSPDVGFSFEPLAQQVGDSLAQERLLAMLSAFFGALALLLAGIGLHGVTAYAVSLRRTEFGIRMALGAGPRRIVTMVLRRVWMLTAIGVSLGVAASWWTAAIVRSLLYGLQPRDPATIILAMAILAVTATGAAWLPAWRASRVHPADILRSS